MIWLTVEDQLQEWDGGFCSEGNLRKQSGVEWNGRTTAGNLRKLKRKNNGNKVLKK